MPLESLSHFSAMNRVFCSHKIESGKRKKKESDFPEIKEQDRLGRQDSKMHGHHEGRGLKQNHFHSGVVRERGGRAGLKFWIILPLIRE